LDCQPSFLKKGLSVKKQEAINAFGSVRKLAEAIGITEQAVHQWGDMVPELRAYQIKAVLAERAA